MSGSKRAALRMTGLGSVVFGLPFAALAFSCRASLDLDRYSFAGGPGDNRAMGGGGAMSGGSGGSQLSGGSGGADSSGGKDGADSSGGNGGARPDAAANGGSETSGGSGPASDAGEPISGDCTTCDPIVLGPLVQGVALTALSPLIYYVDGVPDLEGGHAPQRLDRLRRG